MRQSVLSTDFIRVPVADQLDATADPTTGTVPSLAFVALTADPIVGDWHSGTWETLGTTYYARALVGPGGVALAEARYKVWVKWTDADGTPVCRSHGVLDIF